nr:MAG TPA: hypothetical protein [Caudoviricetes sp.]
MSLPNREIKVEENLHYVKFDETSYVLANSGLTDWTQSANPNTEDGVQYIAEKTAHSAMLGYAPNVAYSGFAYPSDTFNLWLYKVGKEETVGAIFDEVEVETWNPVAEKDGEYNAYHRIYEVQPSNPGSGSGGGKLAIEGTFAQQGSVEKGTFNITTKTFTKEGEVVPASFKAGAE